VRAPAADIDTRARKRRRRRRGNFEDTFDELSHVELLVCDREMEVER